MIVLVITVNNEIDNNDDDHITTDAIDREINYMSNDNDDTALA